MHRIVFLEKIAYLRELAELPEKEEAEEIEVQEPPEQSEPEEGKPEPVTQEEAPEETAQTIRAESFEVKTLVDSLSDAIKALRVDAPPQDNLPELVTALREATRELLTDKQPQHMTINLPQTQQSFAVNVPASPAPQVTVEVPQQAPTIVNVETTAPVINVAAPEIPEAPAPIVNVNVPIAEAPNITVIVEPTPVEITNEVNLPEREPPARRVNVYRDKDGKITEARIDNEDES